MKIKGKEAKIIKEYERYYLIEYIDTGIKEGIHKHDLGLYKEVIKPREGILHGITGLKV